VEVLRELVEGLALGEELEQWVCALEKKLQAGWMKPYLGLSLSRLVAIRSSFFKRPSL